MRTCRLIAIGNCSDIVSGRRSGRARRDSKRLDGRPGGGLRLTPIHVLAILDILIVTVFVVRGVDVRMVLFLGARSALSGGGPAGSDGHQARVGDGQPRHGRADLLGDGVSPTSCG